MTTLADFHPSEIEPELKFKSCIQINIWLNRQTDALFRKVESSCEIVQGEDRSFPRSQERRQQNFPLTEAAVAVLSVLLSSCYCCDVTLEPSCLYIVPSPPSQG